MKRTEVGGWAGGAPFKSNRWFCNVSGLRSLQRCAVVTACWMRPQPPASLGFAVLAQSRRGGGERGWRRRSGGLGAARLAASLSLPGPGAAARLAPRRSGSAGSKCAQAALLGCLADTCLAVHSELPRKTESRGAGVTAREPDSRKDGGAGWEMLVAPPIGNQTGRDWPRRAGAGGGCASLSCTALSAPGSNSSHLLIRES